MYKKTDELYGLRRRLLFKICIMMKLTVFLVVFFCVNVHATVFAQRLSLRVNKQPIKEVLLEIKSKTGYDFLFNHNILKGAKPVTIDLKNASLREVLDACLEGQALDYEIEESTVLIKPKASVRPTSTEIRQIRNIRGR